MSTVLPESLVLTSLHRAAISKDLQMLEKELKSGAVDVNQKTVGGQTPLHLVCRTVWQERVKEAICLLLKNGADANIRDEVGATALMCTTVGGHVDVVATLLSSGRADPDLGNIQGRNPIHQATFHGRWEMVECLLHAGASLAARDKFGKTPIHEAAEIGRRRCLEKLLQAAVRRGHEEVIDWYCSSGCTPLMKAAKRGCVQCVQLLLRFGANPNLKGIQFSQGFTALHYAIFGGHVECIKLLLERVDIQQVAHYTGRVSTDFVCLLQAAIRNRNHDLLKRLLSLGFPVDSVDKISQGLGSNLFSPLRNYEEMLLGYQTPLSFAAARGDIDSVKILLHYGANVNPVSYEVADENEVRQKLSFPPVQSALGSKSWKVLDLLIQHGCDVSCLPDGISQSECLLLSLHNHNATKKLLMCGLDPHLILQQGNDKYQNALWFMNIASISIGCEAFFEFLEVLLQFMVISQPVQHFFRDILESNQEIKRFPHENEGYRERCKRILQQVDKPSSLKMLCRVKIYQVMISVYGCSSFKAAIHRLHLPWMLKEYLLQ